MKQIIKHSIRLLSFTMIGMVISCNNGNPAENSLENQLAGPDTTSTEISQEEIFELIESFPTPLEMALAIKNGNNDFTSDILLSTDSIDRFISSYEKAMAMGAYGADMGYLNIYGKVFLVPDYLATIRLLSVDLDLDNFFDFEKMIEMAENSDNIDSLIQMSTESFNQMEAHLRDKGRDELSLLIVFGTWLEGAYVIADVAQKAQSKEMFNRVAQQKDFVTKLDKIFTSSHDDFFKTIAAKIQPLVDLYEQIEIEIIMKESTMEEINGQLVFIDNSETIIHASDDDINKIINSTIEIRNELLK